MAKCQGRASALLALLYSLTTHIFFKVACHSRRGHDFLMGLTLKSMRTKLQEKIDTGELLAWEPQLPGDTCSRALFITTEINDEFDEDTWHDSALAYRYAALTADFDRYVTGEMIPVGMAPFDKDDSAFMARLDPLEYGIWSIRSVAPRPAIRVFGAFWETDTFVALLTRRRSDLGGRGDRRWAEARESAISRWDALFPGCERLVGENLDDYFSEKAIIV